MTAPFNSVADFRRWADELDHPNCPVAKRQLELREERERETRKAREARAQQQQATNNWESWWSLIDERIRQHIEQESIFLARTVGECIHKCREKDIDYVNRVHDKLREEFCIKLGRPPQAQDWAPGKVFYTGDICTCDGSTYQARRDTCQSVTSDDWVLLAGRGQDGVDGRTPNPRGIFNAYKTYARLDLVECNGAGYLAIRDNPVGVPGIDPDWQLLSRGARGDTGAVGPRGRKGERGARGEAAPAIVSWTLDRKYYRAIPTMSDGRAGAPIELRGLFEQFLYETQGWAP